jgi:hypothetical protein
VRRGTQRSRWSATPGRTKSPPSPAGSSWTYDVGLASCHANPWHYLHPLLLEAAARPVAPVERKPRTQRSAQRRIPADEVDAIIAGYRAGVPVHQLAAEHSCHRTTISGLLKRHGITARRQPVSQGQLREMVRLYESGLSLARVGERLGLADTTVHRHLLARGIRTR